MSTCDGRVIFWDASTRWTVVFASDLGGGEGARQTDAVSAATKRVDPERAATMVAQWCENDTAWPQMVSLYEALSGSQLRPLSVVEIDQSVKPTLSRAFARGRLVLLRDNDRERGKKEEVFLSNAVAAPAVQQAARVLKVIKDPEPELSFIEIMMVDETGAPVAGRAYEVTLPDTTVVRGKLDGSGKARIDGIVGGDCKVLFPDLDQSSWQRS